MKKLFSVLLLAWLVVPPGLLADDLGVVSTADYLRFRVHALDSSGIEAQPDSGHILVWFEGEATANSASYSARWINGGASGTSIDSTNETGTVYYYFVDQVADVDNGEGDGVYTGTVVLFCDGGVPTPNDFTFTLVGDDLSSYWAGLDSLTAGWIRDVLFLSIMTSWDDSAATTFGHHISTGSDTSGFFDATQDAVVVDDTTSTGEDLALLAHLDSLAALAGALFGSKSKYSVNTDVDTLAIVTNGGADTIAYLLRFHTGAGAGSIPDSTAIVAGPDR